MTSTEPMTNKPGPELDAQLARSFGHDVQLISAYSYEIPHPRIKMYGGSAPIPKYSTTWEGIGLVVGEMDRREWGLTLNYDGEQWLAAFLGHKDVPYAEAETAPHACALAAISALQHVSEE